MFRPLPLEARRAHRFRLLPVQAPCNLRRTGIRHRAGVGQRWTTERRESRFGFKLLQSERQRCDAFRGMLRRAGTRGR